MHPLDLFRPTFFSESYARFCSRDIRSFLSSGSIRRTHTWLFQAFLSSLRTRIIFEPPRNGLWCSAGLTRYKVGQPFIDSIAKFHESLTILLIQIVDDLEIYRRGDKRVRESGHFFKLFPCRTKKRRVWHNPQWSMKWSCNHRDRSSLWIGQDRTFR